MNGLNISTSVATGYDINPLKQYQQILKDQLESITTTLKSDR